MVTRPTKCLRICLHFFDLAAVPSFSIRKTQRVLTKSRFDASCEADLIAFVAIVLSPPTISIVSTACTCKLL